MHTIHFVVRGSGRFPFDMLRYDCCTPTTETDSMEMGEDWDGDTRDVMLDKQFRKITDARRFLPTVGRWESFGWSVIVVGEPHADHYSIRDRAMRTPTPPRGQGV